MLFIILLLIYYLLFYYLYVIYYFNFNTSTDWIINGVNMELLMDQSMASS